MSQYHFPILRIEQIVNFFHELNIDICDSDFRKPDVFKWREIYGILLQLLTNIPPDQIYQNSQKIVHVKSEEIFEYVELHNDSLPLMALTLSLKRVMNSCGVSDFTFQDIIEPTMKRLVKICCAAINFYRFRTSRKLTFEQLMEENEKFRDQYKNLTHSIEKTKAILAEEEPEKNQLQQQIEALTAEMTDYNKQRAASQKDMQEMKKDLSEKRAEKDQLKLDIINKEKQIEIISHKIVQSPEKAQKELERNKEKVATLNCQIAETRSKLTEIGQQVEKFKQAEVMADKLLKFLQSIKQETDKEKAVHKEIQQNSELFQELQGSLEELANKRKQLEARLESRQESNAKFDQQFKSKKKALNEQLDQVLRQKIIYKEKHNDEAEQTEAVLKKKQKVLEDLRNRESKLDERVENIFSLYTQLTEKYGELHEEFKDTWLRFQDSLSKNEC